MRFRSVWGMTQDTGVGRGPAPSATGRVLARMWHVLRRPVRGARRAAPDLRPDERGRRRAQRRRVYPGLRRGPPDQPGPRQRLRPDDGGGGRPGAGAGASPARSSGRSWSPSTSACSSRASTVPSTSSAPPSASRAFSGPTCGETTSPSSAWPSTWRRCSRRASAGRTHPTGVRPRDRRSGFRGRGGGRVPAERCCRGRSCRPARTPARSGDTPRGSSCAGRRSSSGGCRRRRSAAS
jgi:hypothetical protein